MKFLCDRCKTRYSIGDDRVRGKILKIRCKNCANVITVREGMSAEDIAPPERGRPTTAAPMASASAPMGSALASAFASQLAKPPPALEEEWYVSIDGDQSGPYSLTDAQRWIAAKPVDADVHCWSEGFDDWLPVDKVSHFRGLRKKAAPPAMPSPPRSAPPRSAPVSALAAQPREEEPKPLFAATMASLEKSTAPPTPTNGVMAKANGTAAKPAIPAVNKFGSGPNRSNTVPGLGGQSAGAQALAAAFDASEAAAADSLTNVESPAFNDEINTSPEPIAARRAFDAALNARAAAAPMLEPESNGAPDEDDSMEIGEVSRVVKLADLAKMGPGSRKNSRAPVANAAALRATGSTPKLDPAVLMGGGTAEAAAGMMPLADPAVVEPAAVAAPVVAQVHRRGLIMLISVAALLLVGVAALVVVMVQKTDDSVGGLGSTHQIDTSRPEELVLRQLPTEGSGSAQIQKPIPNNIRHQPIPHVGSGSATEDPGEGKGDKLKSDEIEDMAHKQSAGTTRCYMRAQRGAEGIEIADLKKLSVTLTVDKTGTVTDVTLSDHGADTFGQCLIGQIKRWKFRESPGGLYRIVLAFAS